MDSQVTMETIFRGGIPQWKIPEESLGNFMLRHLGEHSGRVIQVMADTGDSMTADTVKGYILLYAGGLQSLGITIGSHVVIATARHSYFSSLMMATICCGGVVAPINPNFDDDDLTRLLTNIRPTLVFCMADDEQRISHVMGSVESRTPIISLGHGQRWQAFLGQCEAATYEEPLLTCPRDTVAAVMCSSGTTGFPKSVQVTHGSLLTTSLVLGHDNAYTLAEDTLLHSSPLYWVTGVVFALSSMHRGITVVYAHGLGEEQLLAAIERFRPQTLFMASNLLVSLAKHPLVTRRDLSSLRNGQCGGAAMAGAAQRQVMGVMGIPILQGYGMTEVLFVSGMAGLAPYKVGSVGRLAPMVELKVVDQESGRSLGVGQQGELMVRSPQSSPGYLHDPQATAEVFLPHGWVRTGDLGLVDRDGCLFITGRCKDIIKFRGDHVSPASIEAILTQHPDVIEAAVVGVPHPTDQEHPRAFVVCREGATVTPRELEGMVRARAAPHKWLRGGVHFLPRIPKTTVGKIQRNVLRAMAVAAD